jgi:hypothetical protein
MNESFPGDCEFPFDASDLAAYFREQAVAKGYTEGIVKKLLTEEEKERTTNTRVCSKRRRSPSNFEGALCGKKRLLCKGRT